MNQLLDRFCRYVQVETTADFEAKTAPSSPGQLELGRMLVGELLELGLQDASMTPQGIVMATVPATQANAPTIAWFAHLDTSPEASGRGVKPVVHRDYNGGDIPLPGDPTKVIRVTDCPELKDLRGKTLITSDGTTLLGADDKCGVAAIMTAAELLLDSKALPHGAIRVCFTCDEEIGRGTDHVDLDAVGAVAGYTLDGEGHGVIEAETFSADQAVITIQGRNIHPGLAFERMINSLRVAGCFLAELPREMAPETTRDRQGFLHPYTLSGGVDETRIKVLLRSFETAELASQASLLHDLARRCEQQFPGSSIRVDIEEQYRNMAEWLKDEPRPVQKAQQAMEELNIPYALHSIRGGTDGSRLTEKGLPTPNLSVGMHNFHSPLEFACLEEMEMAVNCLVRLAACWAT